MIDNQSHSAVTANFVHLIAPPPPPTENPCARKCYDGTCVPSSKVCDFFPDCAQKNTSDNADEKDCDGCDFGDGSKSNDYIHILIIVENYIEVEYFKFLNEKGLKAVSREIT